MSKQYPGIDPSRILASTPNERVIADSLNTVDIYLRDDTIKAAVTGSASSVSSLTTNSGIQIKGDITFNDGTAIDITQGGQAITIAVAAAGIDHGLLAGLTDDDHAQYILVAGTRAFTGNQAMGSNKLTGLAVATASGDAMAHSLNVLNNLATATGNYSMGGFNITSIGDLTNDADDTINIISDKADGSSAQAVRVIADIGATPSSANDFQYFAAGFDGGSGYVDQILLYRTDVFGPGVGTTDTGTWKGFIGYPGASGRHTGLVWQPSLFRIRVNNDNAFELTVNSWNVLSSAAPTFNFINTGSLAGQASSIFRYYPTTTKTAGELITFENPVGTNRWEVDFAGAVIQQGGLTVNGAVDFSAGQAVDLETVTTTSATLGDDDYVILVDDDTAASTVTITLPAATSNTGRVYHIKKLGTTASVVVDGNASETIDGGTTATLATQFESISIVCDGSNWSII